MEHPDFRLHLGAGSPLEKYPAKQHARRVADFLGVEKGLIYLPGAPTAYLEDSDQFVPFRQRRYFYYLTGVDEADCHLTYDIRLDFLTLYVPSPGSPRKVYYNGRGSTPEEALDKYDVDAVDFSYAVPGYVEFWMTQHEGDVYILHPDQAVVPGHDKSPRVNYTKLQVAIDAARVRKDQHEIRLIRKANQISAKAHEKVLRNIRAFKNEAQVEATFLDTCVAADAKHQAYEIIAASGENAATLHYIKNDEPFHDRPLMCLDAGCEWQCYASDVTRTFPLTGQWPSKESKAIYDLVLKMQTECIDAIRPGARYLDIHYLAHRILIDGLLELGILHNGTPEDIFDAGTSLAFLPHGLGHHLGLEVHDVSDVPLMAGTAEHMSSVVDPEMCKALVHPNHPALEEGMVVTVEPGIYFNRYALNAVYLSSPIHSRYINRRVLQRYLPVGGVRIEDDILVTDDGYENLTTAPKGEEMLRIMQDGCVETLDGETPRKRQRRASVTKVRKEQIHQDSVTKSKGIEAWSQDVTAGPPEPFRKSPESTTASNVVELEGSQAGPQTPKRSVPASLAAAPASFEAYDWPIHEGVVAAELPSEPERNSEMQVPGESQASHWRKVPSALARMASTQSLSNHSLPEYSPSQMFQRPRQAPMPPQKLPELPAKPLAYRQSMPIIISGSQAVKPLPYRPLCAQPSGRPRPGPSRSASERLPDKMRFRLSESNLPATVAETSHDGLRNEQDRHLTHRASIAIGEKYPQQAYPQENQFHGMGPRDFQPQHPQFSASHQERMHQLAQQRQMAQNQRLQQMKNASNNNIDKDSPPPASLNRPLDPANVPLPDVVSPRLLERPLDHSDLPYHLFLCEIPSQMRKESGMPEAAFPPLAPLNCLSDPNIPPPHVVPPIVRKRPLDLSDLSYQLLLTEMQNKMRQKSGMRRPVSGNECWFSDRPGWQDYWTELKKVEQQHREQHQERLVARQQQERLTLQQTLEATFSPPAPLNRPLDPWNIPPPSLPQPDLLKRPVELADASYQLMLMEVQNKKRIALGGPTRASNDLRWWFSDQPGWQEYQKEIMRLLEQNKVDPSSIPRSGVLPPDLLKRPLDLSDLCYQFKLVEMQNNSRSALGRSGLGSNDGKLWFSELPGWQEYWMELMRLIQENTERITAMQDIQMPLELLEQQNKKRLEMARQEHREKLARENGTSNPEERPTQPTSSSPSPSSYYTAGFDMKY